MRNKRYGRWIFGILFFGALFVVAMSIATLLLWNWLVPALFNGPLITFWQALGLLVLVKLLTGFSGWGHHGWRGRSCKGYYGRNNPVWRERMEAKMEKMSPEQKEKLRQYFYDRCGWKFDMEQTDTGTSATQEDTPV